MNDIRVALAGECVLFRAGMRRVIEAQPNMRVAGEGSSPAEAARLVETVHPDVLAAVHTPSGSTWREFADSFCHPAAPSRTALLVVSDEAEFDDVRQVFTSGVDGFVLSSSSEATLIKAIDALAHGRRYLDPALGAIIAEHPLEPRNPLTSREQEIAKLVALGYTNREIAQRAFASVRTIETHRANIMKKLGCGSRPDLVRWALKRRLIA